ncbi:MAG: LysE family transporter [Chitinophagaceae bacterium]|jgi:threonine/homoserine/homoserine lactone efflux protein|nr:LysE family transporter [Chitinophagaceae bacterium]
MHPLVKVFITGMIVSFLGSLPLGTLNIAAMQISISNGYKQALLFSLGSLLVEVIYVRISLVAIDWVRRQEKLLRILEWVTLAILIALAVSSFYAALSTTQNDNIILSSTLPRFWLGVIMCAVNPVQIPFWFGWSAILFTKKILLPRQDHYYLYISGIGIGTFIGNCIFIFGGLLLVENLNANQHVLNYIIGFIFGITALIQIWRMKKNKSIGSQLDEPEKITGGLEESLPE